MSKKQRDLLKAKQKKQKIIVVVGGVLLLAVLAFQVPRMMKQMNQLNGNASASSGATTTTASTICFESWPADVLFGWTSTNQLIAAASRTPTTTSAICAFGGTRCFAFTRRLRCGCWRRG